MAYLVDVLYNEGKKESEGGASMDLELKSGLIPVARAEEACDVYCPICHKVLHLQAGDVIPRCCGKVMEVQK